MKSTENINTTMKTILGLDLGTTSIGWALVKQNFDEKQGEIIGMGSRIIPMGQDVIGEFEKGNKVSKTADRTHFRSVRRLRERFLLRRERLHRVLNVIGFLPEHYAAQIDFEKRFGKFLPELEPKINYVKGEFLFIRSFHEMLDEFKSFHPEIEERNLKIPHDWTLYFLRKKALTSKIEKEELAWLMLNFNQKRGYSQLRGEEEEELPNKLVEFHSLRIIDVKEDEPIKGKNELWYSLILENGWIYRRSSKASLFDWIDKTRDFIVTTDLNDDGTIKVDKEGKEKRSFRAPGENDWTLLKKKTEQEILLSEQTVGTYIYNSILQNPKQKIKGKLVRTIERKFYKDELKAILQKQIQFHPELKNETLYSHCVRELYKNNESHQLILSNKGFEHLFIEDILFYQRPLKSKKSLIGRCSLESRTFKNEAGEQQIEFIKAIPKSNPLFQEFRLWQWLYNISIYKKDDDSNVTSLFLNDKYDFEELFTFLNNRKEIEQKALIKYFLEKTGIKGKVLNTEVAKYRWNFVEDKKYPCNETGTQIRTRLAKVNNLPANFLTSEKEMKLWHLIYSVTDKQQYEQALKTFANKNEIDESSFFEEFKKFPPFPSEFGSFSHKAINKLLPFLRIGKYWDFDAIDSNTQNRIEKFITGEFDEEIEDKIREKLFAYKVETDFQGIPIWLASYIVYGRHSEAADISKWKSVADLTEFIEEFKQHSLRNPIVEQVVAETVRVVKDIWIHFGNGAENFFNEIHIELGRDMKNTIEERKRLTSVVSSNENTNLRIKALLAEMLSDQNIENVRPYSPSQQEILKIYEDGVLSSDIEIEDDILKISKMAQPSKAELTRYKLWLEQKYRSPYTGKIIPMNRLFTSDYEIEHVIPQSRFFDDSFSNKVICESAVNKKKDKQLGLEFIKNHGGEKIDLGFGTITEIFNEDDYLDFVKTNYANNRGKRNKLLLEEIPEKMIDRQLNDTRYISKYIMSVLSNLVREEKDDAGFNSKNIVPGNGKITTRLKNDWGLNDVWNDLILPRFERMNEITNSTDFTSWNENHQKFLPTVPLELSKGFQKKRIDHRHHAMDALVIACATRNHVSLLNNEHAKSNKRFDLNKKLRLTEKATWIDKKTGEIIEREVSKDFIKPWPTFTKDAKDKLEKIIVSFKQNIRVINKTTNYYESYKDEKGNLNLDKEGKPKKGRILQTKGDSWAIRKPMHKDTVSGIVRLRKTKEVSLNNAIDDVLNIVDKKLRSKILELQKSGMDKKKIASFFKDLGQKWGEKQVSKVEVYYWENEMVASRVNLDTSFSEKRIVETITDTGIQKILLVHLENYKNRKDEKGKIIEPETLAFSPEGIDEMNKNIKKLNNGKFHQPILKIRTYETKGNKFQVGYQGNKSSKFVEAAKGTNLFFAVYQDENGKRNFETIPLNEVVEHQKWRGALPKDEQKLVPIIPVKKKKGTFWFYLSPNDLVILDSNDEFEGKYKVHKFISASGSQAFFVPCEFATSIVDKQELSTLNKMEKDVSGKMIKTNCKKIKLDRLGNIEI